MSALNRVLQVLTLRCEAASALASQELDGLLAPLDRAALYCHLALCRSCRRFRKQIRLIRAAAHRRARELGEDNSHEERLSTEARERIARAIRQATRADSGRDSASERGESP
jgi:predicted anti-sigma-YlaC factor YlaD